MLLQLTRGSGNLTRCVLGRGCGELKTNLAKPPLTFPGRCTGVCPRSLLATGSNAPLVQYFNLAMTGQFGLKLCQHVKQAFNPMLLFV